MKNYLNSKLYLFNKLIKRRGDIITDENIPQKKNLKNISLKRNINFNLIFNRSKGIELIRHKYENERQILEIRFKNKNYTINLNLIGKIQIKNILMAILAAHRSGLEFNKVIDVIHKIKPVEGRLEKIGKIKNRSKVILDYAHTPAALKMALLNIKEQFPLSKVNLVFGCGGVWSGIRFHNNKFLFLNDHLNRLFDDAKKINLKIHLNKKQLTKILFDTIKINKMKTDVHIRLVVSRGIKSTPYQDPAFTISKPTIVVIPEYKQPQETIYKKGLILKTVKTIRGPHNVQDPRINSLSKLNCIIACIEAKKKKADEALMFDINGNIATNNSTHFFFVKNNCVYTSTGQYCVKGITRQKVIDLCKKNKIKVYEKNFKLKDVLNADEAFVTGTFANIIPVKKINNKIYNLNNNLTTKNIRELYLKLMDK